MLLIQTVEYIPSINYLLFSLFLIYPFATHLSQVDNTLNQPQNCAPLANIAKQYLHNWHIMLIPSHQQNQIVELQCSLETVVIFH